MRFLERLCTCLEQILTFQVAVGSVGFFTTVFLLCHSTRATPAIAPAAAPRATPSKFGFDMASTTPGGLISIGSRVDFNKKKRLISIRFSGLGFHLGSNSILEATLEPLATYKISPALPEICACRPSKSSKLCLDLLLKPTAVTSLTPALKMRWASTTTTVCFWMIVTKRFHHVNGHESCLKTYLYHFISYKSLFRAPEMWEHQGEPCLCGGNRHP